MKNTIVIMFCILMNSAALYGSQAQVRHSPTKYQERMQKARKKVTSVVPYTDQEIDDHFAQRAEFEQTKLFADALSKPNFPDAIQALVKGANPHVRDADVDLPLWIHIFKRFPSMICTMLLTGIDVKRSLDAINQWGMTILMYAAQTNNNELANFVIEGGVDINQIDQVGHTALWYAVHSRSYAVLTTLLAQSKVKRDLVDGSGMTPLEWAACYAKRDAILVMLLADKATQDEKDSALHIARLRSNEQAIKALLSLNAQDDTVQDNIVIERFHAIPNSDALKVAPEMSQARVSPQSIASTSSERSDSLQVQEWNGDISQESSVHEIYTAIDKAFLTMNSEKSSPLP